MADATIDTLELSQWDAQKNRLRKDTRNGQAIAVSLDRNAFLHDGNMGRLNCGLQINKYDGGGGKSGASDASAEFMARVRKVFNDNAVLWQPCELGKPDIGGGGTIAKYVANRGIPVIDIGVPVLSMHSPFEVIHKTDLYMAYRTFSLFCQAEQ